MRCYTAIHCLCTNQTFVTSLAAAAENDFIIGSCHHWHPGYFCLLHFLVITKSSGSTAPGCELPQNTRVSNTTEPSRISQHPSAGDDGSHRQRWNAQERGFIPVHVETQPVVRTQKRTETHERNCDKKLVSILSVEQSASFSISGNGWELRITKPQASV